MDSDTENDPMMDSDSEEERSKLSTNQCQWSFASSEKLKDHVEYLHSENLEKFLNNTGRTNG